MTTRNLTAAVGSLMSSPEFGLRVMAHITTASETLYLQTGIGQTVINTITYTGVGQLGGIDKIKDDTDNFSPGLKLWLSASSSSLLAAVLQEQMFNRPVSLYRSYFQSGTLVNTPELWFKGRINEVVLNRGDQERGDHVTMECRTLIKKEAKSSYYTREDLWLTYSGDTGFNYHSYIPGFKGQWGNKDVGFGGIFGDLIDELLRRRRGPTNPFGG